MFLLGSDDGNKEDTAKFARTSSVSPLLGSCLGAGQEWQIRKRICGRRDLWDRLPEIPRPRFDPTTAVCRMTRTALAARNKNIAGRAGRWDAVQRPPHCVLTELLKRQNAYCVVDPKDLLECKVHLREMK